MKTTQPSRTAVAQAAMAMSPLPRTSSRRTAAKLAASTTLVALVAACAPAPMPVSQSPRDPSSPSAPEGVAPILAAAPPPVRPAGESEGHEHHHDHGHDHGSKQAPPSPAPGHQGHGERSAEPAGDAEGTVYVCPMHPEVTSSAPGVCPKCNMKLVPRK